ncbi:Exocyst complex component EXO70A1 [Dichanthelium oligosanthes]|uniref:Exocyst complex component EXO70A1 n=1 Tax=Dichanthelium oligosanthes TaxID=888268 RepID=A0A1E5W8B4_9POAL|nr:Exocyst complex component EXO70A1 [Dichanthelium oligosanthes]
MGAAVAKALQGIADTPGTPAEARLAVAAHAVLQWDRSPDTDGAGIWDAEAMCGSRSLISAVDEILHLKETRAFPMASPACRRMDGALGVAMSRLMDEFLLLRVWDASQLEGRDGLRVAVEKLSVSLGPGGGVCLAFPTGGSTSTGEFSVSTTDELHASGTSLSSWPDALTAFVDGTVSDDLHLICPASLPVLHDIALLVIRAGYTKELLKTFTKATCHVLDRFLSILQLDRPFFEANRINFEDAEWWTAEDMVKRWILATKLTGKALAIMQRQLMAQKCGAFDRFKDDYFTAIAKQSIFVLLKFADGFTSTRSPEKLIYVLELYETLSNSAPGLLPLFTGQHMELISRQVPVVLAKLARALRAAIGGLITNIRTDCSQAASATLGVGVHPLARYAMTCVELLAPHRAALDLIHANGCEDERGAPAGGAEELRSFGSLVSELIAGLECNLDEKSALAGAGGSSSHHLFLANNASFVLKRAADADVASLLGDEWAARRRSRLEQHASSYIQAAWAPAVACLETATGGAGGGKPAKALAKFNAAFEKTHGSQVCLEVPDPELRVALRKAVTEMAVPAYSAFLQKHRKLVKSVSMGAAVGKPALGSAFAPRTQAEERLAVAEHALLQWTRSPGADMGIWDADASYTNRGLLAAVDDVLLLAEEHHFPLPGASSARRRLDGAVAAAASRMVEEFLRVRVWDAGSRLRVAVDRLALASSGVSLLVFPSAGDDRTSAASSGGEVDASDGTRSSRASSGSGVPDEVTALLEGEVWDELDLVRPAGVSVLHEIALRMVRAGCTEELFRAFANAPCDVLDRFLSILWVECSQRTTEAVIKRWTTVTKIIGKAIVAMRRQLHAQNPGPFDSFRDEYLLAIAENRILILLEFANGFTAITSHEKLVYMLGMYEALTDAAPSLLFLFSGARKELVSERTQDILTKLADAMRIMVSGVMAKIQGDCPHTLSAAGGVHPLAREAMACVELLARHRTTLDLILADADQRGAPAGSLAGVVTELIAGLERNLQGKLALACADAGGSRHLFLANNVGFILDRAADAGDVASLLGEAWAARRRSRLAQHVASYVNSSWGPAVALLETPVSGRGKPAKILAEFNAAFTRTRDSEVCREVPGPALRAALRNAVSEVVVPAYCAFLQKHPKLGKSVRHTADDLAESLSELFEGEAGR